MKILLFNANFNAETLTYTRMSGLPLGVLSITTYLNNNGHDAALIDRFYDSRPLDELTDLYRPDLVGITLMSATMLLDTVALSDYYRGRNIPVVIGGTHASIIPEMLIRENKADYVVIGEGEQTWLELADALRDGSDPTSVPGLYFSDGGEPKYSGQRDFIDLSVLGPTDFTLVPDIDRYFQSVYFFDKMLYLYMSKGCTGTCRFCFNPYFHRCRRRARPVEHLFDEIEFLIREHGLETVYFADELWGLKREEREGFYAEKKRRGLDFIWGCQTRIGVLKRDDIKEMYDNGCRWIMFGIEAPPGKLEKLVDKRIPYQLIQPTLLDCRAVGMITNISFIINYPFTEEQDLRDTVSFAKTLTPTYISFHYYVPLEKSELYYSVVENGMYKPAETLDEMAHRFLWETVIPEFSDVPEIDFKVVRASFQLKSLLTHTPRSYSNGKSFILKAVKSVLINLDSGTLKSRVIGFYYTAKYFFDAVGRVVFHPLIRKKYGLNIGYIVCGVQRRELI